MADIHIHSGGRDKTIVELRTNERDPDQVHDAAQDLQKFFGLFAERSREYGDHAFVLGSAGQYADMSRKFGKIKTAMWDKKPEQLTSESIEEVLMDMIGHCLLSIQCLRREGVLGKKVLYRGQSDESETGDIGMTDEEWKSASQEPALDFGDERSEIQLALEVAVNWAGIDAKSGMPDWQIARDLMRTPKMEALQEKMLILNEEAQKANDIRAKLERDNEISLDLLYKVRMNNLQALERIDQVRDARESTEMSIQKTAALLNSVLPNNKEENK